VPSLSPNFLFPFIVKESPLKVGFWIILLLANCLAGYACADQCSTVAAGSVQWRRFSRSKQSVTAWSERTVGRQRFSALGQRMPCRFACDRRHAVRHGHLSRQYGELSVRWMPQPLQLVTGTCLWSFDKKYAKKHIQAVPLYNLVMYLSYKVPSLFTFFLICRRSAQSSYHAPRHLIYSATAVLPTNTNRALGHLGDSDRKHYTSSRLLPP